MFYDGYRTDFLDSCASHIDELRPRDRVEVAESEIPQWIVDGFRNLVPARNLIVDWVLLEAGGDQRKDLEDGLRGRLRHHRVPVHNRLISWAEVRDHVLRISDELSREMDRDFVIVVDGIDHAERSSRYDPTASEGFSIPCQVPMIWPPVAYDC